MRARTFGRLIIAGVTLAAMLALGGTTLAAPAAVSIQNSAFVPQAVTVNVGEAVTWTNRDFSQHTATAAGVFDTGVLSQNQSRAIVMTRAGTFQYRCEIHTFMTGTVTVIAPATPPPTPPPPPPTVAPTPVRTPTPATPAPTPPPATVAPTPSPTASPSPTPAPTAEPTAPPSAVAQSSPSPRTDPPAAVTAPAGPVDGGPGPTLAVVAALVVISLVGLGTYLARRR